MKEILIDGRMSKSRVGLSLAVAIIMLLLGMLNFWRYGVSAASAVLSPWIYISAGLLQLLLLFVMYRHPSSITINEEGIYFHNRNMALVPWEDVFSIEIITRKAMFTKTQFLKIMIKNASNYVKNEKLVTNGMYTIDYSFEFFKETPEQLKELLESYRANNQ